MGEMKRQEGWETEQRLGTRLWSTIAICASIIAAVRLARVEKIDNTPEVRSVIGQSVNAARIVIEFIRQRYPDSF